jgi:UDP-N-acetylglucosamine--N-acetylmuramyl-(pentapeptide) pyrophosphoryl-undecaprenol N-acetylglucosamine transferase
MSLTIFAGGGTGGHLYPGLAIAEALAARDPAHGALFLCSPRPIDARILSAERARFHAIPAAPLVLRPRALLRFLRSWGAAVRESRSILARSTAGQGAPVRVVAMGGFVAAPVVQAARAERLPVTLVNLDAVPGRANRWIARHASEILAVAGAERLPGARPIRPIVRRRAVPALSPQECRAALGLAPDQPTLFVTGGSQGAASINNAMSLLLRQRPEIFRGWQALHQSGEEEETPVQQAYDDAGIPARVLPFCRDMGAAWGAADLAIGRCGAGAVAEVWAAAVPAVFLPYPFHRDQHQRYNALPLAEAGGAVIVEDRIAPEANLDPLALALEPLLTAPDRLEKMRLALRALGPADGADAAADAILQEAQN